MTNHEMIELINALRYQALRVDEAFNDPKIAGAIQNLFTVLDEYKSHMNKGVLHYETTPVTK